MSKNYGDIDFLHDGARARRFIDSIQLTLTLGAALTLASVVASTPDAWGRIATCLAALLLVAVSRWLERHKGSYTAIATIIVGSWLLTAGILLAFSGVHSSVTIVFPFLIGMSGWIMGRRWLIAITVLTTTLILLTGLAQHFGLMQTTPRIGALPATFITASALLILALLTGTAIDSFVLSRNHAVELTEAMAMHNLELAQRERELQLIMDKAPAGIAAFDAAYRLRFANVNYASMFDYRPEQLIGRPVQSYVPPHAFEFIAPYWQRCLAQGMPQYYRRTHRDPHSDVDSIIDVELTPDIENGKAVGLFALVLDVTEKVRAEEQIHELNETLENRVVERSAALAETLEKLHRSQEDLVRSEAKATLTALIAGVSHELNTPLGNGVMTASALNEQTRRFTAVVESGKLKRSELSEFLASLNEGLALMERNLMRAEDLMKNFKQVAADQASEQRRRFDLALVVKEIVDTLAPSIKRKPHRIVLDIPEGIIMDSLPGPLGQVIINLVNNAYLHAFEGRSDGVLTISACQLTKIGVPHVRLRVADNGAGIADENLKRLFEPFFSTKIGQGGTGLGMTIVENLVRKSLGGALHVESTVDVGTTFDIDLPLVLPESLPTT